MLKLSRSGGLSLCYAGKSGDLNVRIGLWSSELALWSKSSQEIQLLRNAQWSQLSLTIALSTKILSRAKTWPCPLICTLSKAELNGCNNGASVVHACVNALNTFAICNCSAFLHLVLLPFEPLSLSPLSNIFPFTQCSSPNCCRPLTRTFLVRPEET